MQNKLNLPKKTEIKASFSQAKNFTPIKLITNQFKVILEDIQEGYFVYDFVIDPEIDIKAKGLKRNLIQNSNLQLKQIFGNNLSISGENLWSTVEHKELITIKSEYCKRTYFLSFSKKFLINKDQLQNEDQGNQLVHIANNKIKSTLQLTGLEENGKKGLFFNPKFINNCKVKDNFNDYRMNVWRGFKTSVCIQDSQMYLNIDFASRLLSDKTALEVINENCKNKSKIDFEIVGKNFMCKFTKIIFKCTSIDYRQNPYTPFPEGSKFDNIASYYKEIYGETPKDEYQPLLVKYDNKQKKSFYYIPEFLTLTGISDQQRSNYKLMSAIAQFTSITPNQRVPMITDQIFQMRKNQKNQGINIDIESNETEGYLIDPPNITINGKAQNFRDANFMHRENIGKSIDLNGKNWIIIYQKRTPQDAKDADNLFETLRYAAQTYKININQPGFIEVKSDNPEEWIQELNKDINKFGAPKIIVSLLERKQQTYLYSRLKEYCLSEKGIIHQNVVKKSIQGKSAQSICSKILLQMQEKLGKDIWKVELPKSIRGKNIMVIGVDIFHKLIDRKMSCAAFIACGGPDMSVIYADTVMQDLKQEKVLNIDTLVANAVKSYLKQEKNFPDTILFYRDAMGEGDFNQDLQMERDLMMKKLQEINPNYQPQFAHIIVNKRIIEKFFAQGNGKEYFNPKAGTVIIGKRTNFFTFYLVAQKVNIGTSNPTKYVLIYNSTNLEQQEFVEITNTFCYMYYNWSGAVKVPMVIQNAHKLSNLMGDTYAGAIHENIKGTQFFL